MWILQPFTQLLQQTQAPDCDGAQPLALSRCNIPVPLIGLCGAALVNRTSPERQFCRAGLILG